MTNLFSGGTCELLNDAIVNAIGDASRAGMPDWEARAEFMKTAGNAFDMIAGDQEDAEPAGSFSGCYAVTTHMGAEFLG